MIFTNMITILADKCTGFRIYQCKFFILRVVYVGSRLLENYFDPSNKRSFLLLQKIHNRFVGILSRIYAGMRWLSRGENWPFSLTSKLRQG